MRRILRNAKDARRVRGDDGNAMSPVWRNVIGGVSNVGDDEQVANVILLKDRAHVQRVIQPPRNN